MRPPCRSSLAAFAAKVTCRALCIHSPTSLTVMTVPPRPGSDSIRNHAAFIWSVADLVRGDYKQSEYGKVVLPLTVIHRLDCVLESSKQAVLEKSKQLAGKIENVEPVLRGVAGQQFFNTSPLTSPSSWMTPTRSPTPSISTSGDSPRRPSM
jgi:hypothetical protein